MDVWLTVLSWLIFAAVLLFVAHQVALRYGFEDPLWQKEFSKARCFFLVFSAMVQQGTPNTCSFADLFD